MLPHIAVMRLQAVTLLPLYAKHLVNHSPHSQQPVGEDCHDATRPQGARSKLKYNFFLYFSLRMIRKTIPTFGAC